MEGLGCLTSKLPERKSGQQLCPKDSWKQAQLQLGLRCLPPPLSAHSLHSLLTADRISPRGGCTASGPQLACTALLCKLEKAPPLLPLSPQPPTSTSAPEAVSQLQSLVSRRHFVKRKRHFIFLDAALYQGPRFGQQKQVRFQPESCSSPGAFVWSTN